MLRFLAAWTAWYGPLRVFDSITFRALLGLVVAFLLSVLTGERFIRWMRRRRATEDVAKPDSATLHALHSGKAGTPTMGGALILGVVLAAGALTCDPRSGWAMLGLAVLLGFGLLGFWDDYRKLRGLRHGGLTKKQKLLGQALLGGLAAAAVAWGLADGETTRLLVPFTRWEAVQPDLGVGYYAYFAFVMLACSNAVNLTDGLDGLAAGCTIMVAVTFAVLAYVSGNEVLCRYFRIPFVPGAGELAVYCGVLVGAVMGFLWFNCHPARVFMGDTGSLALGAGIAYAALAVKQELVLILVGGVFVLEAASVLLQVGSVRGWGRRLFRCAPFHHHLEFSGWHENQVVTRLWLVGAMLAVLGLATLKMH